MNTIKRGLAAAVAVIALGPLTVAASADADAPSKARQSEVTFKHYRFRAGGELDELRMHYATVGQPHRNADGVVDNAILMLPWTGGSSADLLTEEFRSSLFAPGAPFDAGRYFVVLPDPIGHGQSSKPSDGLGTAFPRYGYQDMVDLQYKLVTEALGLPHLKAVVGMSMGCMNAWQWAERYPGMMDGVMPIACFPAPVSGRNLMWRKIAVNMIETDPASLPSVVGLISMMIDGVGNLQERFDAAPKIDGFLQGVRKNVKVDANDLLYALKASGDFDAEPALGKIEAKVYALNFADDEFYPDSLQILQRDVPQVRQGRYVVRPKSPGSPGHLSMSHPALWADHAREFIQWSAQK
ncbi:alpha/beta fold hydrolase [Duganella radicis]|uniref:Alpha/beta fold hydrolase n=1 Tax=Duganella radicis TaxID=551988 RepID=A0A6L6PH47_9BURK|nr:alpha/beta fold hydrolase [Duganella radicis]MTV37625.1 alpha/beta fold hydrolase [Duganella radicis]